MRPLQANSVGGVFGGLARQRSCCCYNMKMKPEMAPKARQGLSKCRTIHVKRVHMFIFFFDEQ